MNKLNYKCSAVEKRMLKALRTQNVDLVMNMLRSQEVSPNHMFYDMGVAPMHLAVGYGIEALGAQIMYQLLRFGGNPNLATEDGVTPVHVAASWGRTTILHLLLIYGGDPWRQDNEMRNAFNYAFEDRAWASLEMLHNFQITKGSQTPIFPESAQTSKLSAVNKDLCNVPETTNTEVLPSCSRPRYSINFLRRLSVDEEQSDQNDPLENKMTELKSSPLNSEKKSIDSTFTIELHEEKMADSIFTVGFHENLNKEKNSFNTKDNVTSGYAKSSAEKDKNLECLNKTFTVDNPMDNGANARHATVIYSSDDCELNTGSTKYSSSEDDDAKKENKNLSKIVSKPVNYDIIRDNTSTLLVTEASKTKYKQFSVKNVFHSLRRKKKPGINIDHSGLKCKEEPRKRAYKSGVKKPQIKQTVAFMRCLGFQRFEGNKEDDKGFKRHNAFSSPQNIEPKLKSLERKNDKLLSAVSICDVNIPETKKALSKERSTTRFKSEDYKTKPLVLPQGKKDDGKLVWEKCSSINSKLIENKSKLVRNGNQCNLKTELTLKLTSPELMDLESDSVKLCVSEVDNSYDKEKMAPSDTLARTENNNQGQSNSQSLLQVCEGDNALINNGHISSDYQVESCCLDMEKVELRGSLENETESTNQRYFKTESFVELNELDGKRIHGDCSNGHDTSLEILEDTSNLKKFEIEPKEILEPLTDKVVETNFKTESFFQLREMGNIQMLRGSIANICLFPPDEKIHVNHQNTAPRELTPIVDLTKENENNGILRIGRFLQQKTLKGTQENICQLAETNIPQIEPQKVEDLITNNKNECNLEGGLLLQVEAAEDCAPEKSDADIKICSATSDEKNNFMEKNDMFRPVKSVDRTPEKSDADIIVCSVSSDDKTNVLVKGDLFLQVKAVNSTLQKNNADIRICSSPLGDKNNLMVNGDSCLKVNAVDCTLEKNNEDIRICSARFDDKNNLNARIETKKIVALRPEDVNQELFESELFLKLTTLKSTPEKGVQIISSPVENSNVDTLKKEMDLQRIETVGFGSEFNVTKDRNSYTELSPKCGDPKEKFEIAKLKNEVSLKMVLNNKDDDRSKRKDCSKPIEINGNVSPRTPKGCSLGSDVDLNKTFCIREKSVILSSLFDELAEAVRRRSLRISASEKDVRKVSHKITTQPLEELKPPDTSNGTLASPTIECSRNEASVNYVTANGDLKGCPTTVTRQSSSSSDGELYQSCIEETSPKRFGNDGTKNDDDCLREKLLAFGRSVGPVTDSTRPVYKKLLQEYDLGERVTSKQTYQSPRTPNKPKASSYKSPRLKLTPVRQRTPDVARYQVSSPCKRGLNYSSCSPISSPFMHNLPQVARFCIPVSPYSCRGSYRPELEAALEDVGPSLPHLELEEEMRKEFRSLDGAKTFYNYLLLDEGITQNLPDRKGTLSKLELTRTFLEAIFYIGKGKSGRPYDHLQKAAAIWKVKGVPDDPKEKRIVSIWETDRGIICLQIFHNSSSDEALTREAAMIDAIGRDNLTNLQKGKYYRRIATWPKRDQRCLGVCLLFKARDIFISDGERALRPFEI